MPVDIDLGPRRFRVAGRSQRLEPLLREAFAAAGWVETRDDDFDLLWDLKLPTLARCREIDARQRHSRLWGLAHLRHRQHREEHLAWAKMRLGAEGDRLYDFPIHTLTLPDDAGALRAAAGLWVQRGLAAGTRQRARLLDDLAHADLAAPSVVQPYVAPHLLDGCKYLLRFFVLVSSVEPLELHLAREGLCRRALRPFSLESADPEIHQPGFGRRVPAAAAPRLLSECRERLRAAGVDDEHLVRRVRRLIALTVLAAQRDILAALQRDAVPHEAGFELLAFDVLVDTALRPRLADVGFALPFDDDASGEELALERALVSATLRRVGVAVPGEDDLERILPDPDDPDLLGASEVPRYEDLLSWRRVAPELGPPSPQLLPDGVIAQPVGEHLALLDDKTGRLLVIDRGGAEIWRAVEAGRTPVEIVAEGGRAAGDREAFERDVWNTLSAWSDAGLLRRSDAPSLAGDPSPETRATVRFASRPEGSDELRFQPDTEGCFELPAPGVASVVFRRQPNSPAQPRAMIPAEGLQRLVSCGLCIEPGLGEARARELLGFLAGLRYTDAMPVDPEALPPRLRADVLAEALEVLDALFRRHQIWYSLAYGSLLGALRDGDIIPWDYDLDLMVRGEDLPAILPLSGEDDCVFTPIVRKGSSAPFNPAGLEEMFISAVTIHVRGRLVGELYAFSLFNDGVMRRFDPSSGVYWWPHSSFPHFLVEDLTTLSIRGRSYPAPAHAEKWIEINYGSDWRTPYRAATQGGRPRAGSTDNSDRYAPRLREHIAWCEARGWDRARYREAHPWPRTIAACGPYGATPRTRAGCQAMWYRSLDEVLYYY